MKQRILIVEDDLTIQTQLKNLLSGNGYEVGVVSDFSKVIEQVKTFAPHLVLLDIKLPGSNGFDICSQIRAFSDLPIIFVTSSNTDMDELNSIMLGGDAFITKPYNTAIVFVKRKCEQKGPKKVSTFSTRFHVVSNVFPKYQMLTF